jgi:RHS repeat-associated protein
MDPGEAMDEIPDKIWTATGGYYSHVPKANQLTVKGTNAKFASPTYYKYDKNGSLTDLVEPAGTTKHAYNAAGLIARTLWRDASFTYYYYDGRLQRYALNKNGTINYFLWDNLDLLQELKADGTVQEEYTQAKSPIAGIGQLVETNRPGATPQKIYPVMDPRGTITKYIQSDGNTVLASREYDAFGTIIPNSPSGTWPGIFGYQGQAWQEILSADKAQRLLLSPTRVYDPVDGRFVSKDPLALKGPSNALPPYLYVVQSPLVVIDRDGRDILSISSSVYSMGSPGAGISPGFGGGIDIVVPGTPAGQPNVSAEIFYSSGTVFQTFGGGISSLPGFNPMAFNPLAGAGAAFAWAALGGLAGLVELRPCDYYQDFGDCPNFRRVARKIGANPETFFTPTTYYNVSFSSRSCKAWLVDATTRKSWDYKTQTIAPNTNPANAVIYVLGQTNENGITVTSLGYSWDNAHGEQAPGSKSSVKVKAVKPRPNSLQYFIKGGWGTQKAFGDLAPGAVDPTTGAVSGNPWGETFNSEEFSPSSTIYMTVIPSCTFSDGKTEKGDSIVVQIIM